MTVALDSEDTTAGPPEARPDVAPPWLFLLGGALALAASALTFFGQGLMVELAGYLLSAVLASTLIALYRRQAYRRLVVQGVAPGRAVLTVAWALMILAFVCSVLHGLALAWELTTR